MEKTDTTNPVEDLLQMWKEDSKIDRTDPGTELSKIGSMHSKYLMIMSMNRQSLKKLQRDMKRIKKIKWEYYTGKMDAETLKKHGWTPFPYVLKSDLSTYIDADKDILMIAKVMDQHQEIVDICESILKELNSRTFQLRDIITWARFIAGG